jgi:hypothetical protein
MYEGQVSGSLSEPPNVRFVGASGQPAVTLTLHLSFAPTPFATPVLLGVLER